MTIENGVQDANPDGSQGNPNGNPAPSDGDGGGANAGGDGDGGNAGAGNAGDPNQNAGDGGDAGAGDSDGGDGGNGGDGGDAGDAGDGDGGKEKLYDVGGRQLNADQLAEEYTSNLLPALTKATQKLSAFEKAGVTLNNSNQPEEGKPDQPKWADPEWVPESYSELMKASVEANQLITDKSQKEQEDARTKAEDAVKTQLTEIRKEEPNLSDELLFQHANKYGFSDLKVAFKNMKDFNQAVKRTEQKVVKNMQGRAGEQIAGSGTPAGSGGGNKGEIDFNQIAGGTDSAIDFLRRVRGK